MRASELIPNLFRTEYRKIVSVLTRRFGLGHIEVAEDIASETFLTAAQTWGIEGVPDNPKAWLYTVAGNKAKNQLQRRNLFEGKISGDIRNSTDEFFEVELDLSDKHIEDSQLQMMFAICHAAIPPETQVGLCLRILCGFGIEEIADAFLSNKETINKRLMRGKDKLREEKIEIILPDPAALESRLDAVLTTIYLLFNEGYYSISRNTTLRKDLCIEAIRLCTMLVEYHVTNRPQVNALLSLMCFHASRFEARFNDSGDVILYGDQDTNLWDTDWVAKGGYFLMRAGQGDKLHTYHLEAAIAYWSTQKEDVPEKWKAVLQLYDQLLSLKYSPIAALNRTYALSKVQGNEVAIAEAEKLNLTDNHFYYSLLGELYVNNDRHKASQLFERAHALAKSPGDKEAIQRRRDAL